MSVVELHKGYELVPRSTPPSPSMMEWSVAVILSNVVIGIVEHHLGFQSVGVLVRTGDPVPVAMAPASGYPQ